MSTTHCFPSCVRGVRHVSQVCGPEHSDGMSLVLSLINREAETWLSQRLNIDRHARIKHKYHPQNSAHQASLAAVATPSAPNVHVFDSVAPRVDFSASGLLSMPTMTEPSTTPASSSVVMINQLLNDLVPFAPSPAAAASANHATVDAVAHVDPPSQPTVTAENPASDAESVEQGPSTLTDVAIYLTLLSHRLLQCAQHLAQHGHYEAIIADVIPVFKRHSPALMQGTAWPFMFFAVFFIFTFFFFFELVHRAAFTSGSRIFLYLPLFVCLRACLSVCLSVCLLVCHFFL
jgi:hypothetical protein